MPVELELAVVKRGLCGPLHHGLNAMLVAQSDTTVDTEKHNDAAGNTQLERRAEVRRAACRP